MSDTLPQSQSWLTPPGSPSGKTKKQSYPFRPRMTPKPIRLRWHIVILLSLFLGAFFIFVDVLGRRRVLSGGWYTGTVGAFGKGAEIREQIHESVEEGGSEVRVGPKVEVPDFAAVRDEWEGEPVGEREGKGKGFTNEEEEGKGSEARDGLTIMKEITNPRNSFAFVTLLCDDVMLESTLVLSRSLRKTGTTHPFIVLTLPSVSEEARQKLMTPGVGVQQVQDVPQLSYPFHVNDAKRAINKMCRYSKLHLWNMTQYDKIVFLDADMLVVKNIDDLFNWPEFSAVLDMGGVFNTGVFVAEPANDTFHDMLKLYRKAPSYNRGDQGFLNWYFTRSPLHSQSRDPTIHVLPPAYNTPIKLKEYAIWPDTKAVAKVFHFTSETKPWSFWKTKHRHWQRNFDAGLFWRWIRVRDEMEREIFGKDTTHPLPTQKPWRNHNRTAEICSHIQPYYSHFPITEKYSVLIGTWDRVDILIKMIDHYRTSTLIHTIFITWHNPSAPIPKELMKAADPQPGPKVEFLKQTTDSLNNRFNPVRRLKTKAVFIADEDIRIPIKDVDLAFSVWQANPDSLVGFFPRTHKLLSKNKNKKRSSSTSTTPQKYEYTHRDKSSPNTYSIVLTKAMFTSSDFLFTYTCLLPPQIHAYIDSLNNCEDIAFNMMVSGMTGKAPVVVKSEIDDFGIRKGISTQGGHYGERSVCLNRLVGLWGGGMTLRYNDVVVGRWEKTHWRERNLDQW